MLLVRRRAPAGSYFTDGDRASGVFGVIATGFSVLLGFIVFLAFTSYDQSRSGAESEARLVAQQLQTAQFFRASVSGPLTGQLVCYGRFVVDGEWPKMRDGDDRRKAQPVGCRDVSDAEVRSSRSRTLSSRRTTAGLRRPPDREQARQDRSTAPRGDPAIALDRAAVHLRDRLRLHAVLRRSE